MPKCKAPSGIKINGVKIEHLKKPELVNALEKVINHNNWLMNELGSKKRIATERKQSA